MKFDLFTLLLIITGIFFYVWLLHPLSEGQLKNIKEKCCRSAWNKRTANSYYDQGYIT